MSKTVHLGYAVGTAEPVGIPIAHMAVTGQTQQSGKTTTLEALVSRAQRRSLAFVTKRGEGAFEEAARIRPYFRDRIDWQYLDQLIAAVLHEKNKQLRPTLMRLARGVSTLGEFHGRVKDEQAAVEAGRKRMRDFDRDQLLVLDHYLDLVVPEIERADLANHLALGKTGLHVVDVESFPLPVQMLCVQSALDWVNDRERSVTVIVPEAWEMVPQGGGSPVKRAAIALARKGAAIGNFLWLDSQDLAGVDNEVLRGCTVWLLGVQREANEIKRVLANIPKGVARPTAADVALLERGQFFACWGKHCIRTYVQPEWMGADEARARARGETPAMTSHRVPRDPNPTRTIMAPTPAPQKEDPSMCQQHQALAETNERLQSEIGQLRGDLDRMRGDADAMKRLRSLLAEAFALAGIQGGLESGAEVRLDLNEDAIVARIMARIPPGGAVVQVTPPAKLRADFQREEVARLLAAVHGLNPLAKQVLKLLEAIEGDTMGQPTIAARLGRSYGGGSQKRSMADAVAELEALGVAESESRVGVRARTRDKIAADLAAYQATPEDIEATYQAVLHAIATGAESTAA